MRDTSIYLTGIVSRRQYVCFHCALAPVVGQSTVVCRNFKGHYLERTSVCRHRVLLSAGEDPDAVMIKAIKVVGGASARIGVENGAWPLNAWRYEALRAWLPQAELVDVGRMVAQLRLIKYPPRSPWGAGAAAATAGATERDVAIAISSAMIRAGSDHAEPGPITSGERAFHIRNSSSDRVLRIGDTVHLEMCPHVPHHHARFMRPVEFGPITSDERALATDHGHDGLTRFPRELLVA